MFPSLYHHQNIVNIKILHNAPLIYQSQYVYNATFYLQKVLHWPQSLHREVWTLQVNLQVLTVGSAERSGSGVFDEGNKWWGVTLCLQAYHWSYWSHLWPVAHQMLLNLNFSFGTFKKLVENLSDDLKKNDIINFVLFFCGCWMCMFVCFFCLCYEYLTWYKKVCQEETWKHFVTLCKFEKKN